MVFFMDSQKLQKMVAEIWGNLAAVMTPVAAYCFLVFNLLCAPCFAAMGAIKREMNNTKWFWFAIGYQCGTCLCCISLYLPDWYIDYSRIRNWYSCSIRLIIGFLYLLFRPYKESNTLNVNVKTL